MTWNTHHTHVKDVETAHTYKFHQVNK